MMKWLIAGFLIYFPLLALAQESALNFSPPPGDYSVVFLSNIFGMVDGVLHGTGSQIMGAMFGVFNSAVLALGGILVMYTIIVGTMNTAHEGNPLGKNWSSLWVPVRSVAGIGLIVPQASGYCMMQIFVMWVVVQGVGAADKVWDAALSYLNRGGTIIQAQMNPVTSLQAGSGAVEKGAAVILQGQVCMLALQQALETARQNMLNQAQQHQQGPCYQPTLPVLQQFCQYPIPDFVSSVNVVNVQQQQNSASPSAPPSSYSATMPGLTAPPYNALNGVCGTVKWNALSLPSSISTSPSANPNTTITVTQGELNTAQASRAIAIQQMYVDLSTVANTIVRNMPILYPQSNQNTAPAIPLIAQSQFGVPYTAGGAPCTSSSGCVAWGTDPTLPGAPLFNGTEFQGAVADYNGIMAPTLTLMKEAQSAASANQARAFIDQASQQGWMMAGSYFFNLASLNAQSVQAASNATDTNTGLDQSTFNITQIVQAFPASGSTTGCAANNTECLCQATTSTSAEGMLCRWLSANTTLIDAVQQVVTAQSATGGQAVTLTLSGTPSQQIETGAASSTVNGFINNSVMVQLPGQPGQTAPQFAMHFNINLTSGTFTLPSISFPCGGTWWTGCIGSLLGDVLYNLIFRTMFNVVIQTVVGLVNATVQTVLSLPLLAMAQIFLQGVGVIQQPSINPIVALANMGVYYINFAMNTWIYAVIGIIADSFVPLFGFVIVPLITLLMPIIAAWLVVMVLIGFTTAYYIPFYPYMIFTFGTIAWLMVVIEAMVAAPIVALGVSSPEGDAAFGKGEHAIMLLLNVFLRPGMMIIGYIAAIALSFVSVWIINAGFSNVVAFTQGPSTAGTWSYSAGSWQTSSGTAGQSAGQGALSNAQQGYNADGAGGAAWGAATGATSGAVAGASQAGVTPQGTDAGAISTSNSGQGYPGWAGIFGFFFAILVYTTMYITVVQESFNLITSLPDKILRWIGGQAESLGQETGKWAGETKEQVQGAGKSTAEQGGKMGGQLEGGAGDMVQKLKGSGGGGGGSVGATPTEIPPV